MGATVCSCSSLTKPGAERVHGSFEQCQQQPASVLVWELRVCGQWQVPGWWNTPRKALQGLKESCPQLHTRLA